MLKSKKIAGDLIQVVLIAVLFLVILILVVFSAISYQKSVEIQDMNNNTRAVLTYVTTAVKASPGSHIEIADRGGQQVLVISEEGSEFEQQIFFEDGNVLEAYVMAGSEPYAPDALVVGEAQQFEMSLVTDELLEIQTNLGTSYVHIR